MLIDLRQELGDCGTSKSLLSPSGAIDYTNVVLSSSHSGSRSAFCLVVAFNRLFLTLVDGLPSILWARGSVAHM